MHKFTYLTSSISSTESDVNMHLVKAWTAIDRLSIISDKIKWNFFHAAVVSVRLYRCTTQMLTKFIKTKLDENCTRILGTILNKSWKQHPMKQLHGHLPPISKTIRTRHARHCRRHKNKLIRDILLWTPFTWICQCWLTNKNLLRTTLCRHWI